MDLNAPQLSPGTPLSDADTDDLLTDVRPLSNVSSLHSSPKHSPPVSPQYFRSNLPYTRATKSAMATSSKSLPNTPFSREAANEITSRLLATIHQSPDNITDHKSRSLTELYQMNPDSVKEQIFSDSNIPYTNKRPFSKNSPKERSPIHYSVNSRSRSFSPRRQASPLNTKTDGSPVRRRLLQSSPQDKDNDSPHKRFYSKERSSPRDHLQLGEYHSPVKSDIGVSFKLNNHDEEPLAYSLQSSVIDLQTDTNLFSGKANSAPQHRPEIQKRSDFPSHHSDTENFPQSLPTLSHNERPTSPNARPKSPTSKSTDNSYISKVTNRPYKFDPRFDKAQDPEVQSFRVQGSVSTKTDYEARSNDGTRHSRRDRYDKSPTRQSSEPSYSTASKPESHIRETVAPSRDSERSQPYGMRPTPGVAAAHELLQTVNTTQYSSSRNKDLSLASNESIKQMQNVREQLHGMLKPDDSAGQKETKDVSRFLNVGKDVLGSKAWDSEVSPHFSGVSYPSRVWGGLSTPHSDTTLFSENQILKDSLEKERFRRKHCEKQIQQLQTNMLELQQQVAVAVSTDKKKDIMIEQLDKTLAKVVDGWKRKEQEKDEYIERLQQDKEELSTAHKKQQQMIGSFEKDMRQAVDDLAREQERSRGVEQKYRQRLEDYDKELQYMRESTEVDKERSRRSEVELDRAIEGREHVQKQLEQLQGTLNQERKSWTHREDDLIKKIDEISGAQIQVLQSEKSKFDEQNEICKSLQEKVKLLDRENQELQINNDTVMRDRDHMKVQIGLLEAKMETTRRKMEADFQSQLERVVSEKLSTAHDQMSQAESDMRENHRKHITELNTRHAADMEGQLKQFHAELQRKESAFKQEIQNYEDKLTSNRNEINDLKNLKSKLENQRQEVTSKLASLLNLQVSDGTVVGQSSVPNIVFGADGSMYKSPGQDSLVSHDLNTYRQDMSRLSNISSIPPMPVASLAANSVYTNRPTLNVPYSDTMTPRKSSETAYSLYSHRSGMEQLTHRSSFDQPNIQRQPYSTVMTVQEDPNSHINKFLNSIPPQSGQKNPVDLKVTGTQMSHGVPGLQSNVYPRPSAVSYNLHPGPHNLMQAPVPSLSSGYSSQKPQNSVGVHHQLPQSQLTHQVQHVTIPTTQQQQTQQGVGQPVDYRVIQKPVALTADNINMSGGVYRSQPAYQNVSMKYQQPEKQSMHYGATVGQIESAVTGYYPEYHNYTALEAEETASNIDLISELNDPLNQHNMTDMSTGPLDTSAVSSVKMYGGISDKFDKHDERQTELQHYVKMLLNRSPGSPVEKDKDAPPTVMKSFVDPGTTQSQEFRKTSTKPTPLVKMHGDPGLSPKQMAEITKLLDMYKNQDQTRSSLTHQAPTRDIVLPKKPDESSKAKKSLGSRFDGLSEAYSYVPRADIKPAPESKRPTNRTSLPSSRKQPKGVIISKQSKNQQKIWK